MNQEPRDLSGVSSDSQGIWKSLPDAKQFLQHLKLKGGLPADHRSDKLEVWRYTTESFEDQGS